MPLLKENIPPLSTPEKPRWKGLLLISIRLLISLGALCIVFYMFRSKWGEVGSVLLRVKWGFLALALGFYLAAFWFITYRLQVVMKVQQLRLSLRSLFALGLIGLFFNNFLPSAVGGDAVKAYYAYKRTGKKLESFSAVFVDRILGFFTLIALALVAILCYRTQFSNPRILEVVVAMALASLLVFVFFASRRIARKFKFISFLIPSEKFRQKLRNLYYSIYGYKQHPGIVLWSVFLSLISQSMFIVVNFFFALSLGVSVPLWIFFVLIPIIGAVSMAPSLNGLGIREGAYVYLFSRYSSQEEAFAISLLYYLVMISFSIAGGIVYLLGKGKGVQLKEIESVDVMEELGKRQTVKAT